MNVRQVPNGEALKALSVLAGRSMIRRLGQTRYHGRVDRPSHSRWRRHEKKLVRYLQGRHSEDRRAGMRTMMAWRRASVIVKGWVQGRRLGMLCGDDGRRSNVRRAMRVRRVRDRHQYDGGREGQKRRKQATQQSDLIVTSCPRTWMTWSWTSRRNPPLVHHACSTP